MPQFTDRERKVLDQINGSIKLQSILWDLDLLPEQLQYQGNHLGKDAGIRRAEMAGDTKGRGVDQ